MFLSFKYYRFNLCYFCIWKNCSLSNSCHTSNIRYLFTASPSWPILLLPRWDTVKKHYLSFRSWETTMLPWVVPLTSCLSYQNLHHVWWPQITYCASYRLKGRGRTGSISQSESNFSQGSYSKVVWGHGMDLDGSCDLAPSAMLWLPINHICCFEGQM